MSGDRPSIERVDAGHYSQHPIGGKRNQRAKTHRDDYWKDHLNRPVLIQCNSTLEPNRNEKKEGDGLINLRGKSNLGRKLCGQESKSENQNTDGSQV